MKHPIRLHGTYALFVAAALSFGASQAFATTALSSCPYLAEPEVIGECPRYTPGTCDIDCDAANYNGGNCTGPCCVCFI